MYQSPIEIITKQIRTQFEDNVFKAIQDYGILVDKEELIKALQYDRGQYEKGYADGMLAQKSEWISVEERLPEDYGEVICYTAYKNVCQLVYNPGYRLFNVSYDNIECAVNVTHWMPLPEAPKMKGGADK